MGTRRKKVIVCAGSAVIILAATALAIHFNPKEEIQADTTAPLNDAAITSELTAKRTRFTKQFALSDGTFLASTYSMPAHYKKGGKWKEIDTTLKKTKNGACYKTKSTSLQIKAAKKANKTSMLSLKRGKYGVSLAPQGKVKTKKAVVKNPKKQEKTDILNENEISYKNIFKNTTLTYQIYPEKITEVLTIKKKQKARSFTYKVITSKLKIKVKNNRVYFKTKKGKTKYTRLKTIVTDAKGVSTSRVKVKYNKKKKTITMTPNKKWWNSKKRVFPVQTRTSTITSLHERDVTIGAAYAGAPKANYKYSSSMLLQAGKATSFAKMTSLAELNQPNVTILSAKLLLENEKNVTLGAGKTFDIGIHKVTEKWTPKKLTYNNRPAYDTQPAAKVSVQKKGRYTCDVTNIVKGWYQGEANYGVALVADNTNGTHQAKLDKYPTFTIRYEVVGFDGAVELKENQDITRDVLKAGQENYYYFDAEPGIAYDLYTTSTLDTQGTLYDTEKNRLNYDDNTGLEKNFAFIQSYNGRRYLKVSTKGNATGSYTLSLKKRFAVPEPTGIRGSDRYTITWNAVKNAKEYLVCIYEGSKKVSEAVVTGTSYDFIYTSETAGKTLGFTVTARERAELTGETSRMIYNTDNQSKWVYTTPMQEKRKHAATVTVDGKIYVLGGENTSGSLKTFEVYDTEKKTWHTLPAYPGTQTGICKAAMIACHNEIYVIGGQTDTSTKAQLLPSVYAFDTETKQWQKKADLVEGRTNLAAAVCKDTVYAFTKAGATDKVEIYNLKTDTRETVVMPDTSTVIAAASVDNRVLVLKEKGESMYWTEYLPEDNIFEEDGTVCPFAVSDAYGTPVVISGKIYMVKEEETKEVLVYDVYTDEWSRVSAMNLTKKNSSLAVSGNEIYSIGGEMNGFGVLDTVEQYTVKVQTTTKQMLVNKGEAYELQVTAGNLKKGQSKIVTLSVDPDELDIQNASSFEEEEALKEGADGVTLLKYQPKKGVLVMKLTGSLERGDSYEAYQSIPVEAKIKGKTTVEITLTEKEEKE